MSFFLIYSVRPSCYGISRSSRIIETIWPTLSSNNSHRVGQIIPIIRLELTTKTKNKGFFSLKLSVQRSRVVKYSHRVGQIIPIIRLKNVRSYEPKRIPIVGGSVRTLISSPYLLTSHCSFPKRPSPRFKTLHGSKSFTYLRLSVSV